MARKTKICNIIDIKKGSKFGKLEVISDRFMQRRQNSTYHKKESHVTVKCECGSIKNVACTDLIYQCSTSCGCYALSVRQKGSFAKNGFKKCAGCLTVKPVSSFHKSHTRPDKYNTACIECCINRARLSKFGISTEQYNLLLKKQSGCCKCCGASMPSQGQKRNKYFHIDHCHKTGRIRGLLCNKCNMVLGHLGDNLSNLQQNIKLYIAYLKDNV